MKFGEHRSHKIANNSFKNWVSVEWINQMGFNNNAFSPVAAYSDAKFALENLLKDLSGAMWFFFFFSLDFFVFVLNSH